MIDIFDKCGICKNYLGSIFQEYFETFETFGVLFSRNNFQWKSDFSAVLVSRSPRYDDGVDDDYFNNDEVDDNGDRSAAAVVVAIKPAACERDNPPIVLPMVEITREIHTLYLSSFLGLHNMKGGRGQRL